MSEPNTPSDEPAAPGLGEDVPSRAEEDDLTRAEQIENERRLALEVEEFEGGIEG